MKTLLSSLSLLLVFSACTSSPSLDEPRTEESVEEEEVLISFVSVSQIVDGEPLGYTVSLSGDYEEEYTFYFLEEDMDEEEASIEGEETLVEGLYFAGMESNLIFVIDGNILQIQEELTSEDGVSSRSVFETITLPENLELRFN